MSDFLYYSVPGMWERWPIIISFLCLYKQHPEYFKSDFKIHNVYGNFCPCIWDGGRSQQRDELLMVSSEDDIKNIREIYNDIFNIPIRLIFTNSALKEEHLTEPFCNYMLSACGNGQNYITINSLLLQDYILKNYPNQYHFISSVTKVSSKEGFLDDLKNEIYDQVCMPFAYNKDTEFLSSIPKNLQQKTEILVNIDCFISCPSKKAHHYVDSVSNLNHCLPVENFYCPIIGHNYQRPKEEDPSLSMEEILLYHQKYNILHFKINGRTFPPDHLLYTLLDHSVLPEFDQIAYEYIDDFYDKVIYDNNFNLQIIKEILQNLIK